METRLTRVPSLCLALMLIACGGGAGTTTASAVADDTASTQPAIAGDPTTTVAAEVVTTTTAPATTTSAQVRTGAGVEDIQPECLAAISSVLQTFEPVVRDVDWEAATIEDHLRVMTDLASATFADTAGCDDDAPLDVTDEEGAALFLEVAEQEAPGAVGYFTAILDINEALGGRAATGQCSEDIALFEEVVAGGIPWIDLPLPEQWYVMNLMGSISFCSLQTQGELRFRDEVEAFLAGSPFAGS